ncbi:MAG: transcription termination factor Rho [Clostridiales bacterium]|nr:transcription termination factor Rho [Clostridiales bacterium]
MQKKYTLQELEKLSIFEVRALAKTFGVTSPTKHNKGELVDLIYKISNGLMAPPQPPRHGRPRKSAPVFGGEQEAVAPAVEASNPALDEKSSAEVKKQTGAARKQVVGENKFERTSSRVKDSVSKERGGKDSANEFANKDNAPADSYPSDERFGRVTLKDEQSTFIREGYLEISPENYGFLRVKPGECCEKDAYVASANIRRFGLRRGDYVVANCRRGMDENKPAPLVDVITVNGESPEAARLRPNFDHLTPVYPDTRLRLEVPNQPREYAMRCIDLVSPIGKGQRGIIVSPPKAGKTTLLKMIAGSITKNYPDVVLKVLLIDERPEEVTDMQRSIDGEVVYSTFDELPEHHTKTAEMLLERCKRIVEKGKDVVILLDSLTRLARAYNLTIPPTGRTLSGGLDPGALHSPKRFFGSARNLEANKDKNFAGGSLTIIATALVETGSRMDDVIFEEFKGTGNMEIHLDRKLSEKRIFPAIDLAKSSTRKEELLLNAEELEGTWGIRKMLSNTDNADATENLIGMIVKTTSNKEFIAQLNMQLRVFQKEGYTFRTNK